MNRCLKCHNENENELKTELITIGNQHFQRLVCKDKVVCEKRISQKIVDNIKAEIVKEKD